MFATKASTSSISFRATCISFMVFCKVWVTSCQCGYPRLRPLWAAFMSLPVYISGPPVAWHRNSAKTGLWNDMSTEANRALPSGVESRVWKKLSVRVSSTGLPPRRLQREALRLQKNIPIIILSILLVKLHSITSYNNTFYQINSK